MKECLLLLLLLSLSIRADTDYSCSSHCDITFDNDDSCFKTTIAFFEHSLMSTMRNYVIVQSQLQQLRAKYDTPLWNDDQISGLTLENMNYAPFRPPQDEVYPIDDAKDVVDELATNIKSSPSSILPSIDCPIGCEQTSSTWMGLFIASLALNIVLAFVSIVAVLWITRQNEEKAKLLLKRSLEREKNKLESAGRKTIARKISLEGSDDENCSLELNTFVVNGMSGYGTMNNGQINKGFENERF